MYKNNQIIYIIISFSILLINKFECAIYLPFKILENDIYNDIDNKPLSTIKNLNESKLFTELYIGTPPTKIGVFFVSNIYELTILQNMCDVPNSFYNKQNSSSYKHIKKINYLYNKVMNCSVITEKLYLYLDKEQTKNISIDNMMIFYSDNKKEEFNQDVIYKKEYEDRVYEYHPNTCLNIGFQPRQNINFGGSANFVNQIRNHAINGKFQSYDYTFQFISDTNGYLIIGEKAHEFDKNNYKEKDFILTAALNKNYNFDWFIRFNSIYYSGIYENKTSYKNAFKCNMSLKIDLTYGLFEGPNEYEDSIRKDFFDKLIKNRQCYLGENDEFRFYYCDKKMSYDYIQKYFPALNFCLNEYGFCFKFDYKDLFKEKNGTLYFMVYFNKNNSNMAFTAGQIFLKKYLLTFNYDNKMIGFYHKNISDDSGYKNEKADIYYYEHDIVAICIISVVIILVFIIGIFVGKKIYDKTRKKKANELIDDYDYSSQENNKKNEISINE